MQTPRRPRSHPGVTTVPSTRRRTRWAALLAVAASAVVLAACSSTAARSSAARHPSTPATSSTRPSSSGSSASSSSGATTSCLSSSTPASAGESAPAVAAIQFVSPQVGWAAGAGRIVATTDGGARWSTQLTSGADFGEVDFLSKRTGWAVGDHELLGTTDGGRCWRRLAEPGGGSLRMVHFATPTVGFGVAGGAFTLEPPGSSTSSTDEGFTGAFVPVDPRSGGVLVQTVNGGRSWSPVPSAPANAQSICFVNGADGWLGAGGGLYRTTDGGQHWAEVADPGSSSGAAPDGTDIAQVGCGAPTQVWVASDTGGAAAGNSPWAVFASTTGTGATLLQADMYPGGGYPAPPQTPGSYPGAVSVIGAGLAAVTGFTPAAPPPDTTKVEVLNASGQQVEPARPVAGIGQPWGLAFLSATDGWVVGYGTTASGAPDTTVGVIEHTTNGGSTWTVQDRIGS